MDDIEKSLNDQATFAGAAKRRPAAELSLGDEQTLGDRLGDEDTAIDDIEVVDLEARYKVEGALGQGGMGAVLLATDTRLGRKVAIKRILGEAARSKTAIMRFLTEAKAIAALNHQNIVQIYDYGRAKDGPFLIMEYVDGGSLLDRCREGALPLEDAVDLACQLCDGLAKAHDAGIVHRDIKPANVLINKDGLPKLTDFGLAKADAADHGMTMTGAVMGTPDFMSPEQRRDASEVDARSDLWSLAATVYQMVTGRSPKIIRFNDIPAALQDVLGKALEDRKDVRYQTASEFREALRNVLAKSVSVDTRKPLSGKLQEGQCKACGTVTSDLTKKFCRNSDCGATLRVPCLKCNAKIPVWDGVCGECGGNQPALLEATRSDLLAKQAEAEALVQAFAFDEAMAIGAKLAYQAHPELAEMANRWAVAFAESTTAEKDRWQAIATEKLREAEAHVAAWDYPTAIHAIESVPEPLRNEKATTLLQECIARKTESDSLIRAIRTAIEKKDCDGLLPAVERAVALRGDRHDLWRIHEQLLERQRSLSLAQAARDRRDADVANARAHIANKRFKEAIASLARIDSSLVDAESEALTVTAKTALERISSLEDQIWPKGMGDGAIDLRDQSLLLHVEELLTLDPASRKAVALKDQIHSHHKEAVAIANQDAIKRVQQHLADWDFTDALAAANSVPPNDVGPELAALLEKTRRLYSEYKEQLSHVHQRLSQAFAERSYSEINNLLSEYRVLRPHDDSARLLHIEIHKLLEAQSLLTRHCYGDAGKVLETVDKTTVFMGFSPWSDDCEALLHNAYEKQNQLLQLAKCLKIALAEGSRQEIAAAARSYLQLKPHDHGVRALQRVIAAINSALEPIDGGRGDWLKAFDMLMNMPAQLRERFPELFRQAYSEACAARRFTTDQSLDSIEKATMRFEKASRLGGCAGVLWFLAVYLLCLLKPLIPPWVISALGDQFFGSLTVGMITSLSVGFSLLLFPGFLRRRRLGARLDDLLNTGLFMALVLTLILHSMWFVHVEALAMEKQRTVVTVCLGALPVFLLSAWGPAIGCALWVCPEYVTSLKARLLESSDVAHAVREQQRSHETMFPEDNIPDAVAGFRARLNATGSKASGQPADPQSLMPESAVNSVESLLGNGFF